MKDFQFAWRSLWKSPGFTLVAIAALALGIGANTAMFTIIRSVVMKPLAYREPDRLMTLWETFPPDGWGTVSAPNLRDWREQNHSFSSISAYTWRSVNLQGVAQPERLRALVATADLFDTLGVAPLLGRTFAPGEDQPGQPPVAVLGSALWKRRFASDPNIVGRSVTLDGERYTVIGVMPESFQYPAQSHRAALYLPLRWTPRESASRNNHWMFTLARLKPGVTMAAAAADMNSIAERLEKAYPDEQLQRRVRVETEQQQVSGRVGPVLYVLFAAVGAVLLIACANVANLLLARGAVREREMAVRAALGAGRTRLVRLLLAESLVIALSGTAVGLVLAEWGLSLIVGYAEASLPRAAEIRIDGAVFLYLLAAVLVTAIVFGMVPALRVSRVDLNTGLRDAGSKGSTAGAARWLRVGLVTAEVALAFVLLVSTGALMKTLVQLLAVPTGFDAHNVLTFSVSPPERKYPAADLSARFYQPVLERIRAVPGVRAAGAINMLPIQSWGSNGDFKIEGQPPLPPGSRPYAEMREITPGYFRSLNVPVVEGRDVAEADTMKAPHVVFVNQTLARRYFPKENPIGRRIGDESDWMTIAGVVGDVRQSGLARPPAPEIFFVQQQDKQPEREMKVVVRADLDATALTSAIRNAVREVDADQPIFGVETMETVVSKSVSSERLNFVLMGVFSALAVLLASAGVYGVMTYLVSQRTREFGVRLALGAVAGDMMRLVLREAAAVSAVAFAIGIAGALGASALIRHYIPGVATLDLMLVLGVAALLSVVVGVAVAVPARRAMRIDPMEALRWE